MASSAALALAKLSPGPFGTRGVVDADEQGQPTGLLHEDAAWHAWNCAPEPDESQRPAFVAAALSSLAKLGYAEVHDLHSQPWLGRVLRQLESAGQLACDVWLYPNVNDLDAVASDSANFESSRIRLAGGKLFADGTLSSRTAHMIHRYVDPLPDAPRGRCMVSPMQIDQAIAKCDSLGLALATHAIGDGAVRDVLDAIERVAPKSRGFRIEHAELIDRADVPRFVELGVTCSVQPCHLLSDIEALNRSLCHRLPRVLPLRELIDSGLIPGHMGLDGRAGIVFGSDVPIVRADPGDSIQAAVHRRRFGAPMEEAVAIKQAISEDEAWACFALN
jgi:predicted amidohydrolase YtcJ